MDKTKDLKDMGSKCVLLTECDYFQAKCPSGGGAKVYTVQGLP
jgi:hypothetical protein